MFNISLSFYLLNKVYDIDIKNNDKPENVILFVIVPSPFVRCIKAASTSSISKIHLLGVSVTNSPKVSSVNHYHYQ